MYCLVCISVVESFICYILTSGVNINLCVKYKIFVFHRSIFTERLPLKTDTTQFVAYFADFAWALSTRSSSSSSFKAQTEIMEIFVHFLISVSKVKEIGQPRMYPWKYSNSARNAKIFTSHNHAYILSCKHASRPIRARLLILVII